MNSGYENSALTKEEKPLSIVDFAKRQRDNAYVWSLYFSVAVKTIVFRILGRIFHE